MRFETTAARREAVYGCLQPGTWVLGFWLKATAMHQIGDGMRRRLGYGTGLTLLTAGILAGALVGTGWASTKAIRLHADAARVPLLVTCPSATASPGCRITLKLRTTARAGVRAGMVVGDATALIAPGNRRRITISLTRLGRRLLHQQSPLSLIATTVMTTPPPVASTPPAPATTTPTSAVTPCHPAGPPVVTPIGPGPDVTAGGAIAANPTSPLDCAG
jgi:hypothetical protein